MFVLGIPVWDVKFSEKLNKSAKSLPVPNLHLEKSKYAIITNP